MNLVLIDSYFKTVEDIFKQKETNSEGRSGMKVSLISTETDIRY